MLYLSMAALAAVLLLFAWIGLRARSTQAGLDDFVTARNSQGARAIGVPDGGHRIAHRHVRRGADRRDLEVRGGGQLQHGEIARSVVAQHRRVVDESVALMYGRDVGRLLDNVEVGEHQPVGVDDEAGARDAVEPELGGEGDNSRIDLGGELFEGQWCRRWRWRQSDGWGSCRRGLFGRVQDSWTQGCGQRGRSESQRKNECVPTDCLHVSRLCRHRFTPGAF